MIEHVENLKPFRFNDFFTDRWLAVILSLVSASNSIRNPWAKPHEYANPILAVAVWCVPTRNQWSLFDFGTHTASISSNQLESVTISKS